MVKRKDIPLGDTPEIMSRKEYKQKMKSAKWEHNIDAAKKGTLSAERIKKAEGVIGVVGKAVETVADAATTATGLKGILGRKKSPKYEK
jgi:hypothetical protein